MRAILLVVASFILLASSFMVVTRLNKVPIARQVAPLPQYPHLGTHWPTVAPGRREALEKRLIEIEKLTKRLDTIARESAK